jgi:DNA-directed RNA polymerase subunit H (RpoH/RPB5)
MNDIINKINNTRYTLKEILDDEWDVSTIADYSNEEIDILYNKGVDSQFGSASECNFTLKHKFVPSYHLHIIYYKFPELGTNGSKITKSCFEKIYNLYLSEFFSQEDSVFIIINDTISETLENHLNFLNVNLQNDIRDKELSKSIIDEMEENNYLLDKKHFRNVYLFNINSLTNNLLKHVLVPKHISIRNKQVIHEILQKCNCTSDQLPIILKKDAVSKLLRLTEGDICEITRKSEKCCEYPFYRICK